MHEGRPVRPFHFVAQGRQGREEDFSRPLGCADVAGQRLNDLGQVVIRFPFELQVDGLRGRYSRFKVAAR